jgi:hypothetical protein
MNLRIVQKRECFVTRVAVVIVVTPATGKEEISHHHFPKRISIALANGRSKSFKEQGPGSFSLSLFAWAYSAALSDRALSGGERKT